MQIILDISRRRIAAFVNIGGSYSTWNKSSDIESGARCQQRDDNSCRGNNTWCCFCDGQAAYSSNPSPPYQGAGSEIRLRGIQFPCRQVQAEVCIRLRSSTHHVAVTGHTSYRYPYRSLLQKSLLSKILLKDTAMKFLSSFILLALFAGFAWTSATAQKQAIKLEQPCSSRPAVRVRAAQVQSLLRQTEY